MAETPKREHVGIFNPLILPLPNWHPDGPDGEVDGYRIPFVFPEAGSRPANRDAYLRVYPTPHGWRAALLNCQDHAETAAQARAFAGAWIRAAELLDAEVLRAAERRKREAERAAAGDDDVVDAEVVEDDDEHLDVDRRLCCPSDLSGPHVAGCAFEPREDNPIDYGGPVVVAPAGGCPACAAGSCTLHPPFSIGHRVQLLRGDQAGRIGEVVAIWQDRQPGAAGTTVDVRLETTDLHAASTTTVPARDVEFVG